MGSRLTRSRSDRWISGVCGGIAEHLEVEPSVVRLGVLVSTLLGIPLLLPYIVASIVIPEQTAALGGAEPSAVEWGEDHLRITARAPLIPFSLSWKGWLKGCALVGTLGTLASLVIITGAALVGAALGTAEPFLLGVSTAATALPAAAWIAALASFGAAVIPVRHTLTCTHVALWIRGPLRSRRIDLNRIESLRKAGSHLELMLTDGELLHLPQPPTADDLDVLLEVIDDARRRATDHASDRSADASERARLQRLMARQRA